MSGSFLTWTPKAGLPQSLFFDVTTEESQELASTATEHPVESGANIADHVRDELDRVSIEVFVSNSPIDDVNDRGANVRDLPLRYQTYKPPLQATPGAVFAAIGNGLRRDIGALLSGNKEPRAQVLQWSQDFDAVSDTLAVLEKLRADRQLVDVVTSSKTYENMLIEKITLTRNAKSGTGATFRLEFKQLRTVEVRIVNAPAPAEIRGKSGVSKGAQGAKDAKAPGTKKSVLKGLLDRVRKQKAVDAGEV